MKAKVPLLLLVFLTLSFAPASPQGTTGGGAAVPSPRQEATARPDSRGLESSVQGQVFLGAFRTILDYHQTTFSDSLLWEAALRGLLEGLNDPYASVFTPEEYAAFEEQTTGDYAGIGVEITRLQDRVTVTAVFRNTPAEGAGLMVGDRLLTVEGEDARGWTVDQARDAIRGPAGTVVHLTVERRGFSEPLNFSIRRDQVHVSAVVAGLVGDSLAYIRVDRFARGSAQEVDSALALLASSRGIILDLRRNPGGFLVESLNMADLFLEPGQALATARSRVPGKPDETATETWYGRLMPRAREKPMVILVDRFTASAAEVLAGALQDHDRAVVVGERTFGKGVIQTVVPLPFGRQMRLTTGDWMTPLGRSLHIPRDAEGNPLPSPALRGDSLLPTVTTAGGRTLKADGGVSPDLAVADDTLTTAEQQLLLEASKAGVPLALRVAELAFGQVQKALAGEQGPKFDEKALEPFLQQLVGEGLPPEVVFHPEAKGYLLWRARMAFEERIGHPGHAMEIQGERDPAFQTAVRLLTVSRTPGELLARVGAEAGKGRG